MFPSSSVVVFQAWVKYHELDFFLTEGDPHILNTDIDQRSASYGPLPKSDPPPIFV